MKKSPLAALTLSIAVSLAAPACAQDGAQPAVQPAAAPPTHPAKPRAAKLPAAKLPAAKPAAAKPAAAKPSGGASKPAAAGGKTASPKPAGRAPAQPAYIDPAEAIRRADAFFNSSPTLIADFVQIGADGRRAEGKLQVQRPGRLRFEYARPATMEIVSDGVVVAVRDHKLNTQDLYFVSQTPLKFLLNEKIDIERDLKVVDVVTDDSGTTIAVDDSTTFGGTSHIKLIFDSKNFTLKQWQVTDPQGYDTLVSLFNINRSPKSNGGLFKVDQQRTSDPN